MLGIPLVKGNHHIGEYHFYVSFTTSFHVREIKTIQKGRYDTKELFIRSVAKT